MKTNQLLELAGKRRYDIQYAKDLPHYRLLQISRAGLLLSLVLFSLGLFGNLWKETLLIVAAVFCLVSSVSYTAAVFLREEKHRRR